MLEVWLGNEVLLKDSQGLAILGWQVCSPANCLRLTALHRKWLWFSPTFSCKLAILSQKRYKKQSVKHNPRSAAFFKITSLSGKFLHLTVEWLLIIPTMHRTRGHFFLFFPMFLALRHHDPKWHGSAERLHNGKHSWDLALPHAKFFLCVSQSYPEKQRWHKRSQK